MGNSLRNNIKGALTEHDKEHIDQAFKEADKDGNRQLDRKEFAGVAKALLDLEVDDSKSPLRAALKDVMKNKSALSELVDEMFYELTHYLYWGSSETVSYDVFAHYIKNRGAHHDFHVTSQGGPVFLDYKHAEDPMDLDKCFCGTAEFKILSVKVPAVESPSIHVNLSFGATGSFRPNGVPIRRPVFVTSDKTSCEAKFDEGGSLEIGEHVTLVEVRIQNGFKLIKSFIFDPRQGSSKIQNYKTKCKGLTYGGNNVVTYQSDEKNVELTFEWIPSPELRRQRARLQILSAYQRCEKPRLHDVYLPALFAFGEQRDRPEIPISRVIAQISEDTKQELKESELYEIQGIQYVSPDHRFSPLDGKKNASVWEDTVCVIKKTVTTTILVDDAKHSVTHDAAITLGDFIPVVLEQTSVDLNGLKMFGKTAPIIVGGEENKQWEECAKYPLSGVSNGFREVGAGIALKFFTPGEEVKVSIMGLVPRGLTCNKMSMLDVKQLDFQFDMKSDWTASLIEEVTTHPLYWHLDQKKYLNDLKTSMSYTELKDLGLHEGKIWVHASPCGVQPPTGVTYDQTMTKEIDDAGDIKMGKWTFTKHVLPEHRPIVSDILNNYPSTFSFGYGVFRIHNADVVEDTKLEHECCIC